MSDGDLRSEARAICQAGLEAVEPRSAVMRHVALQDDDLHVAGKRHELSGVDGIYVVGMGKASAVMALALEDLLGDRIRGGIVSVKHGHGVPLERIQVREGGHPIPDDAGELALSGATDGTDGPTDAGGAWADGTTVRRGRPGWTPRPCCGGTAPTRSSSPWVTSS